MTVMLRSVGIPARYINGFLTGEYNDVGGDLVVRASDAHSWVEAYFPSHGWLTFDPTLPIGREAAGNLREPWPLKLGLVRAAVERVGNLKLRFPLHQFTLAQNLHRVSLDLTQRSRTKFLNMRLTATYNLERWQFQFIHSRGALPLSLGVVTVIFVGLMLLQPGVRRRLMTLWHLRVSTAAAMTPHLATLQYNEMLRLLARREGI